MAKVSIIGAGAWGIGIGVLLHNNGHQVTVWSAVPSEIDMLASSREHKSLPGVKIHEEIGVTKNLEEALFQKDLIVLAVASSYTRQTAAQMAPFIPKGQILVNVAKGIEEGSLMTLSQVIEQEIPQADVAVLSGPSHAEEVSRGLPTTCVAGAHSRQTAEYIQNLFMSRVFRVYTSPDILGMEIGGALKNVIALAAGIADGLGYGDNTKAALITRGIAEIARMGVAAGGKAETFYGLSGIGDLIVTCASMHSRNRRAGILIGQGKSAQEAMAQVGQVVEGVYAARSGLEMDEKYQVEMPIIRQVNRILFEGKAPSEAVEELMLRDRRIEHGDMDWE